MQRVAIGFVLTQLVHEGFSQPGGELIDAIIVIAEFREVSFSDVVHHQA